MNIKLLERAIFEYALYHNRQAGTWERAEMQAWASRMAHAVHTSFATHIREGKIDGVDAEDGGVTTDVPPYRRWDEEYQEDDC